MNAQLKFDPARHLAHKLPHGHISMEDIGHPGDVGISSVAASEPFQLFTEEAVEKMRADILNPEVMAKFGFKSNLSACQLRGYAKTHARFTYDAWNHLETLDIISRIVEVELVPVMDYEIAHINFSVKAEEQGEEEQDTITDIKATDNHTLNNDKPVVGWHRDSYPFVCVLMLSDCTKMVGGETALLSADGSKVVKVRGPSMGSAVILQGRYVTHEALRALGIQERITAVTSFRPCDPHIRDESVLSTVRGISDINELHFQYSEYRLEMLEARIQDKLKEIRKAHQAGKDFDTSGIKEFLKTALAHISHTDEQLVREEDIVAGFVPEEPLSGPLKARI